MQSSIESLKTSCILTDLHMEAFAPIQTASIAFDVCQGLVRKKDVKRMNHYFGKTLRKLEKNLVSCCDPVSAVNESSYRKGWYQLPKDYLNPKIEEEDKKSKKE